MSDDPLIGRQLANFRIESVIGRGGMAQVYYGHDVTLERPVAIKIIDMRYRGNLAYAQRFVREAQTVATWRHENILQVYYAAQEDNLYYFVMEYMDGPDLGELLDQHAKEQKRIPYAEVIRIGRAVANALDYAHRKGVIHRDVKPSNVMVARDGRVVLADFGIALDVRQGSFGEVVGSPQYFAPEQARQSREAVPQSDLYSLGVILYEMLAGRVPFDDPSPLSVSLQHLTQPPPSPRLFNPGLSAGAEAVLLKALSKSPSARYQTGGELMDALERGLFSKAEVTQRAVPVQRPVARPVPAPLPGGGQLITQKRSGFIWLAMAFALLAVAAMVVVGVVLVANQASSVSKLDLARPTSTAAAAIPSLAPTRAGTSVPPASPTRMPPTPVAPTATQAALPTPTVLNPVGRRFVLYYDDNSFYILNDSGGPSTVLPFTFERLDASGAPLNRLDGERWAQYYANIMSGWCVRAEILGSATYLRPLQCGDRYNSIITPAREDSSIFWTAQPGSRQFRVLWDNKEVARCEIAGQVCQVLLP